VEQVTEVEGDIRSTGLPEGSNPSIPIIFFRRVMNNKDKEAFEKWFKDAWDIDF
jgi:hypothetical protein